MYFLSCKVVQIVIFYVTLVLGKLTSYLAQCLDFFLNSPFV